MITRKPGRNFAQGITTVNFGTPGYELLLEQHQAYVETLKSLNIEAIEMEPLVDYPDAYFVEDTAVIIPEVAIVTLPGDVSRQGEIDSIESVLAKHCKIMRVHFPGTIDGGDVLAIGDRFFIGISKRTVRAGAEQLGKILEQYGKIWTTVPVLSGLHLKSSVNYVGQNTLLMTKKFAALDLFKNYEHIIVDESEEYAANTLLVNHRLLMPKGCPKTRKKLEVLGLEIIELDISEVRKMDGGLTCISLRF